MNKPCKQTMARLLLHAADFSILWLRERSRSAAAFAKRKPVLISSTSKKTELQKKKKTPARPFDTVCSGQEKGLFERNCHIEKNN